MVVVLAPLDKRFRLRRVHVATYQSVSGTGQKGIDALEAERSGTSVSRVAFPRTIDRNVIPQCDVFDTDGFTREELKMIRETRRILGRPDLAIHPTCVRVPVKVGHAEAVHVEFSRPMPVEEAQQILAQAPGVRLLDDTAISLYPQPWAAAGSDEVFVGRIRQDASHPNGLVMWVVSDNLRKGAALNTIQIAEEMIKREWVKPEGGQ